MSAISFPFACVGEIFVGMAYEFPTESIDRFRDFVRPLRGTKTSVQNFRRKKRCAKFKIARSSRGCTYDGKKGEERREKERKSDWRAANPARLTYHWDIIVLRYRQRRSERALPMPIGTYADADADATILYRTLERWYLDATRYYV